MAMNVKNLGQVFTPQGIVSEMIKLVRNNGTVLEPSCGNGAFSDNFKDCVAIEYDETKCPDYGIVMDFFDYPIENKFDTIIGNPPYVRFQDIMPETKAKLDMTLFDERSNLYLFFIYKAIQHLNDGGELIFIVPRELLKATSAAKLNEYIFEQGTITNIIELGDANIFKDACPNCIIFRFEKGNNKRITEVNKKFTVVNGQILFTRNRYEIPFSELFYVKVGAVSGADKVFEIQRGNLEFVCSKTRKTGETRRMFYNVEDPELLENKDILLARGIRKFNEDNWFMFGRDYYHSDENRVYVNAKTRNVEPFFYNPCKAYDGSVLAIFAKFDLTEEMARTLADDLNIVDWNELGFMCNGRYLFSQRSLENIMLPDSFMKYRCIMNKVA